MTREDRSSATPMGLPHAASTEAAILAAALNDGRYWAVAESLESDVESLFYDTDHHRIAVAMHSLYRAGRLVTEDAVVDAIRAAGGEIENDTRQFLVEMGMHSSARNQSEFRDQISLLGEKRSLRRIAVDAGKVSERATQGEGSALELAEEVMRIAEHGRSVGDPIKKFGEYLGEMESSVSYRVPTNVRALNDLIGGWEAGRIYAIAARPKVGKTTMVINSVVSALVADATVLMFSLEMPRRELYGRLLACTAFAPQAEIQQYLNKEKSLDDFPQEQRENIESAKNDIANADLYIAESSEVRNGIHDVAATIMDVKSRYDGERPFVVFIDYLQLLVRVAKDQATEIADITRELKLLAARLDIPIVLLSQINRSGAENDNGMPNPHQMRGSGSIEQDADVTILLNRKSLQDETHSKSDMDIWVALSRYSNTGWVSAYYSPEEQVVTDVDDEDAGQQSGDEARSTPRPIHKDSGDREESRSSSRPRGRESRRDRDDSEATSAREPVSSNDNEVDFEDFSKEFGL